MHLPGAAIALPEEMRRANIWPVNGVAPKRGPNRTHSPTGKRVEAVSLNHSALGLPRLSAREKAPPKQAKSLKRASLGAAESHEAGSGGTARW
jgi:hypothetical protein